MSKVTQLCYNLTRKEVLLEEMNNALSVRETTPVHVGETPQRRQRLDKKIWVQTSPPEKDLDQAEKEEEALRRFVDEIMRSWV